MSILFPNQVAYHGMCLLYEQHGTDGFVIAWDEARKSPIRIKVQSAEYAVQVKFTIDADEAIKQKFYRWKRSYSANNLKNRKGLISLLAKRHKIPYHKLLALRKHYYFDVLLKLLAMKNTRDSFRANILQSVLHWFSGNTKYEFPLSYQQIECVKRWSA